MVSNATLILSLSCSLPFPGSSGLLNEVWTPQEGTGDLSTIHPKTLSHSSFLLTLHAKPTGLFYSLSPKLTSLLSPLNLSPSSSLKSLLCSLCPHLRFPLQAWSKSHLLGEAARVSPAGSGSPCLKHISLVVWIKNLLCLVLFVIMWSEILIWMHYFS